jgi:16S rRNA (guanine966-N2)-methyltransferase
LRIISGNRRGKKLYAFEGRGIRPTADRVREAIFNILSAHVKGAVVLDLFAGTGAFGLEALSRGACSAILIDHHPDAIRLLNKNVDACGMTKETRVIKWDISRDLNCLRGLHPRFELVFMDPPYNRNLVQAALLHLHASGALRSGARIVVEHSLQESLTRELDGFRMMDQRKYGKSLVSFFTYMI